MQLRDWCIVIPNVNCIMVLNLFIFLIGTLPSMKTEKIIATYTETIGPGNYSYFNLQEKGTITVIVESIIGDADIYVSENIQKPSYIDYDLQSSTCGLDIVTIPKTFKRPVFIAIYGHVHSLLTKYRITAILNYTGLHEFERPEIYSQNYDKENSNEEDESPSFKSILWSVVVGILKIILEVMF